MYKFRKVKFIDHPVLGNLELDFCDQEGKAVDTIIIAGENGTGKSTVMNILYQVASYSVDVPLCVEFERDGEISTLTYYYKTNRSNIEVKDENEVFMLLFLAKKKYPFSGIFSDVDINFHSKDISSVTSLNLDEESSSRRSTGSLPEQINQLLVDIQAMDDGMLAEECRQKLSKDGVMSTIDYQERLSRFKNAFNQMFNDLTYSHVENVKGKKSILFKKNKKDVSINNLSSGEKQVVYRGCFLLKDIQAISGAFVFIDEPEISLHPTWQMKIMNYYKDIFTNEEGRQTSQIFAVTHSPFVIHNENRRNDKVIILARDENGNIVVKDRAEYFKCTSIEAVEDAFFIRNFSSEDPTVYLEGRTDEKYFNKVVEIFDIKVPFKFKWVGYLNKEQQEVHTGNKGVDAAFQFLVARNLSIKNICLKDCDTKGETKQEGNVIITSMPTYSNNKGIKKGIENALILDDINLDSFYHTKNTVGDYGEKKSIQEFDKMKCCEAICAMDINVQKKIFVNLENIVRDLIKLYTEGVV